MNIQSDVEAKISARIIGFAQGLEELPTVYGVRIQSKEYTLLIMGDHMPVLGKVSGNVHFLCPSEERSYENIVGFFKHQHNQFTLLLDKEQEDV